MKESNEANACYRVVGGIRGTMRLPSVKPCLSRHTLSRVPVSRVAGYMVRLGKIPCVIISSLDYRVRLAAEPEDN